MATDVEKLVVQLSADFKSYENAMAKASGITRTQLAAIKAEATQAGAAGAAAFDGASRGIQRFGAQAQKTGANVVNLRGQTANLGAQFQDIAVQLQSGTSPLTIALQQGTQISAVLGGAGAGGAVKALGAAFASIVSPVSLVTIGLIAAGGAAIQYFGGLLNEGDKTEAQLKEQAASIRQVAEEWKGAVPALDAYVAKIDELEKREKTRAAGVAVIEDIWAKPQAQIALYAADVDDLATKLTELGGEAAASSIARLQDAFKALQTATEEETASGEDAAAVVAALNDVLTLGGLAAAALANGMTLLVPELDAAAAAAGRAGDAFARLLATSNRVNLEGLDKAADIYQARKIASDDVIKNEERLAGLSTEQLARENEINRLLEAGVLSRTDAAAAADRNLAADERRAAAAKAAKGGASAADKEAKAAEREREAVRKLVEQLEFENTLIGLSNVEREKAVKLRQATSAGAATPEDIARITAAVDLGYAMNDALKANEETLERLRGLSRDVLGGMFEDLRDGADMAEVLANALNRVAENLVNAGMDALISGAFGKPGTAAGGGWLGNLLGAAVHHQGGVVGQPGPSRMVNPAIFAGAPRYHNGGVAGLRPGEVPAILQKGERVIPKGGGGAMAIMVDVSGARGNQEIMSMVEAGVSRGLRAYDSTMPERVMRISADPRKRR